MGFWFFEILGILVCLYYVMSILLWVILDSDIELAVKERFGQPVSILRGKVVWITGASSGIGKALAISLARCGVRLVLSARRESELLKIKEQCLESASGLLADNDVLVIKLDMLDIQQHNVKFDEVLSHFGRLDILVSNAGRSQRADWDTIDLQVDREMFELDVFAVINLSRIAVRNFKQNGGRGHIAVTSSAAGLVPVPYSASYSGAKHALHGYLSSLKVEMPALDVTIFCPGPVATSFLEESFTGKANEKYGQKIAATDKRRMSAERCGDLYAVALANKTLLSWVGLFPCSLLLYIYLQHPNFRMILLKMIGAKGLKKIREGQ